MAERIVGILREQYPDFGPTLAAEKLQIRHGDMKESFVIRSILYDLLLEPTSFIVMTSPYQA